MEQFAGRSQNEHPGSFFSSRTNANQMSPATGQLIGLDMHPQVPTFDHVPHNTICSPGLH
jgi:hypothetical protein